MSGPNLDDYVPVNERIEAFYAKFPDGSIQSEIIVHTDSMIVMEARAFRTADDPRPGVGHSSIEVPGRTPYTRGSEMENCETSAWGRAIAALGFEVKRGIASKEEVESKAGEDAPRPRQKAIERPSKPQTAPSTPATPTGAELTDDDWQGLVGEAPKSNGHTGLERLSSREFFDRVDAEGIDRKVVTSTARKMFGDNKWKVTELQDDERAALYAELVA